MDPLTHTLAGAVLAELPPVRRLGRTGGLSRGLTTGLLLVAANAPDVDVSCYVVGADFALGARRGWTHGVLAVVVLPLLVAAGALLWRRWRSGTGEGRARWWPVLLLAAIGVWSHPLLDLLNVYGVRLLAPFDWTWYYGDAVYIVDPWLWLALGGVLFLVRSRSRWALAGWAALALPTTAAMLAAAPVAARWVWLAVLALLAVYRTRGGPVPEERGGRLAWAAVAAVAVYCVAMAASAATGAALVRAELSARGEGPLRRLMVGPEAADPFHRQVVVETPVGYRMGRVSWLTFLGEPLLDWEPRIVPYPPPTPPVRQAFRAESVAGFVSWVRFPAVEVDAQPGGTVVHLIDLRYARRRTGGFGTATVRLGGP